jgi:hypothetical protein
MTTRRKFDGSFHEFTSFYAQALGDVDSFEVTNPSSILVHEIGFPDY